MYTSVGEVGGSPSCSRRTEKKGHKRKNRGMNRWANTTLFKGGGVYAEKAKNLCDGQGDADIK